MPAKATRSGSYTCISGSKILWLSIYCDWMSLDRNVITALATISTKTSRTPKLAKSHNLVDMVSQIILFSQPRSGSKYFPPSKEFFLYTFLPNRLTLPGHLLERMLTKDQAGVQVLSHPFSASRGKQVPWLLREDYAEGMQTDEACEYEDHIQREVGVWERALDEAEAVSLTIVHPHTCPFQSPTPRLKTTRENTLSSSTPTLSSRSLHQPSSPTSPTSLPPGPTRTTSRTQTSPWSPTPSSCTQAQSHSSQSATLA